MSTDQTRFAIRSRRVITGDSMRPATVLIEAGKIVDIVDWESTSLACRVHDIGDLVLMPGLVDTHVHINEPGRTEWEGFDTATQAAAAGGITCVVDMPLNCTPVTTSAQALRQKLDSLQGKLWIDCGFWGGVVPDNLAELAELVEAGVLGVKSFTIHSGIDDFPKVDSTHIRQAMHVLARYDVPYLIHAELEPESDENIQIGDQYQSFLASRPKSWENNAIEMMIELAKAAATENISPRVHIVHLSSAQALAAISAAQKAGIRLSAETCPHYLTLMAETIPDGKTLFKCCPPIREDQNRQQLWQGLENGTIEFVVSDHSPCTPQLKHIDSGDLEKAWGGISSLQFGLSIIWTEAIQRGISLQQVTDWMATRPANFAGLQGRKGRIAIGYDADMVVFDDRSHYTIDPTMIRYRHKVTPYEGREVVGVVEQTYLRGQLIFDKDSFPGSASGNPILADNQART